MRRGMWACAVALVAAGPAAAFYFPGWPADGLRTVPTLYGPSVGVAPPEPAVDRAFTRPLLAPQAEPPRVPEPSTLVLAGIGLLAVRRRLGAPAACTG